MCLPPPGPAPHPGLRAFSLVELLVAMAVLALLLVLLANMSDQVTRSWKRAGAQAEFYAEARSAMDLIARRLSQATLNPYLAYDDPANPQRYIRKSNLRFLIEPASRLLGPDFGPGSALFFHAPLGRSEERSRRQLVGLLNTCGFYVKQTAPPGVPFGPTLAERFFLMEFQAPAEQLAPLQPAPNASSPGAENSTTWATAWAADTETQSYERELAENVILFLARPLEADTVGNSVDFSSAFAYSSSAGASLNPQPATANQLPPFVEIVLVVISAESATRFDPADTNLQSGFANPDNLETDLVDLAGTLAARNLQFRILRTQVTLPNSRWRG